MARVGEMLKEGMVDELAKQLSEQPNVFVTSVNRLTASDANVLRAKLHASRASFVMVKRRIGLRTLERLNLSGIGELLEGSVAFILTTEDVLPIAKQLVEFIKSHEDQLGVRGAWIDGQLLDKGRVEALAKLPPKPVLLAEVVGTVERPLSYLISTIEQLIGDVAWLLEQAAANRSVEPAPTKQEAAGGSTTGASEGRPQGESAPAAASGEQPSTKEKPSEDQGAPPEALPKDQGDTGPTDTKTAVT